MDDYENQHRMTISSPQHTKSDRRKEISAILARLSLHYYRPEFSKEQYKLLLGDYVSDLIGFNPIEVEAACSAYRRKEVQFFPKVGEIIALIRQDRPSVSYLPKVERPKEIEYQRTSKLMSVADVLRKNGFERAADTWNAPK